MKLPKGTTVAVLDGEKFNLFRSAGDESPSKLTALEHAEVDDKNNVSGGRHHSSSANPDDHQIDEDSHAAGVAELLNKLVLNGRIKHLLVIAPSKTLGELRKHYHARLLVTLVGEIGKDLAGSSSREIEAAIASA